MKHTLLFLVIFLVISVFSVNAADIIVLKDGTIIDAKVIEINPTEIKYKRADNLNGPMIIILKNSVLSIRYENGVAEVLNASPPAGQQPAAKAPVVQAPAVQTPSAQAPAAQAPVTQAPVAQTPAVPTPGLQAPLQNILNTLPAISIAGNNLKFQFNGANWTALLNGENFSAGTVEVEDTAGGSLLTLRQTHIWPGAAAGKAAGKLGGKLAGKVPGGSAVAGAAVDAAGKAAGPVEASGPAMVLEYKAGPPAKLAYLKNAKPAPASTAQSASASSVQSPASSVQSVPASAPVQTASIPVASALDGPVNIVLADAQWRAETFGSNESLKNSAVAQFNIANEQIDGWEGEVLTLETKLAVTTSGQWKRGHFSLENQNMVQQLRGGSGVRFKVLGDGRKWTLQIPTTEGIQNSCYFESPIATKRGKVVEIDIPYSKLKPEVNGKKVPFMKESITSLTLFIVGDPTISGPSTIKVFDFEIY